MTEVWMRNVAKAIRECVEANVLDLVFDIGYLYNQKIDIDKWLNLYLNGLNYRVLVVGRPSQGAAELRPGYDLDHPYKRHPVWEYGQTLFRLVDLMGDPEHDRVVITQLPDGRDIGFRAILKTLSSIQEDHPETKMHVHALYGFRSMFNGGFGAVDFEPRTDAAFSKVHLPNGKKVHSDQTVAHPEWVTMLGMDPVDLKIPRNRTIYNIKSATWAGKNWHNLDRFVTAYDRKLEIDPDTLEYIHPQSKRIMFKNVEAKEGDKFLCNMCSLQLSCRYFREGAVCAVPESEPTELARFFKTRDSGTIIEGLGTLLATNTHRLKKGMEIEEATGELDPEVTKIVKQLFDGGVKLAKLVDPALAAAGAPKIQFNQQINSGATPQALMASIVSDLEGRGVPRDMITPEMVTGLMNMAEQQRTQAIEAQAIASR